MVEGGEFSPEFPASEWGNDPNWGKLLDIQMLIIGGRKRTKKEFAAMFAQAGLKMTRVVPTKCPLSIVEGVRA